MKKPILEYNVEKSYDYHDVIKYIEGKYNIDTRDYKNSHSHFGIWLKEVKEFKRIHAEYSEYKEWCKTNPCPEYLDFWHWISDVCEIHNGGHFNVNFQSYLDEKEDYKAKEWIKEIIRLIIKEFPIDEGDYTFYIDW